MLTIYNRINDEMWTLYNRGELDKATLSEQIRFERTFLEMGYPEKEVPKGLWEHYIDLCPTKTNLMEGCIEILDYLSESYDLHLISNGFAETQDQKTKEYRDWISILDLLQFQNQVAIKSLIPEYFEIALQNAGLKRQNQHICGR